MGSVLTWARPVMRAAWLLLMLGWPLQTKATESAQERRLRVSAFLTYVEQVATGPCSGGTGESLTVDFNVTRWDDEAEVAMRMANQLTKLIIQSPNNTLAGTTEEIHFNLVRTNVDRGGLIFGSAIAVEPYLFPRFEKYSPYSYRNKSDVVHVKDLSLGYNYLANDTEWYHTLRIKDWSNATVTLNMIEYRYTLVNPESPDNYTSVFEPFYQPMAKLEDGHWTNPYFDCGGGDIWMVTYSAPIFGMDVNRKAVFRGVGTIDIELTYIDINQCPGSGDIFENTDKCPDHTQCEPISGSGFVVGSYQCPCVDGYYFPDLTANPRAFSGKELENFFSNNTNATMQELSANYKCLRCAEGCDTCVDKSPCLYSYKMYIRTPLLILTLVMIGLIVLVSIWVMTFGDRRAIKSASPIFLHCMTTGAALYCLPTVILFWEPNRLTCTLSFWPQHLGFALLYGALLLKTWRISVIFKVKSARKVALTDKFLARRLAAIVALAAAFLLVWTFMSDPGTEIKRTDSADSLKFLVCRMNIWSVAVLLLEGLFLLWGAYLCYSVRKAPSHFNESKYITWAIYNNIILGSFIIIIRQLIAVPKGPDVLYAIDFLYIQIVVTGTMCLIFIPKLVLVKLGKDSSDEETSITGRKTGTTTVAVDPDSVEKVDAEAQTIICGMTSGQDQQRRWALLRVQTLWHSEADLNPIAQIQTRVEVNIDMGEDSGSKDNTGSGCVSLRSNKVVPVESDDP